MSTTLRWLSISGFAITLLAMFLLFARHSLFGESPVPMMVQLLAISLMVWARVTFGWRSFHASGTPTGGGLVTSGPYRYLRHPIYAAVLYFIWAGVLSHISAVTVLLGVIAIGGAVLRMGVEERLVVIRYPEYKAYADRTARIIPFLL